MQRKQDNSFTKPPNASVRADDVLQSQSNYTLSTEINKKVGDQVADQWDTPS